MIDIPSYVNGKDYEKSLYLHDSFRLFINSTRKNIIELIYLFQNDLDNNINDQLNDILSIFDNCISDLVKNYPVKSKFSIIQNFYTNNTKKLETLKDLISKQIYPKVKNLCSSFSNENVDSESLFQEFYCKNKEISINFETVKIIDPPNYYDTQLSESECENYDKFVAVVNTIICLREIINFSADFNKKRKEFKDKEKATIEQEKQDYLQKFIETNDKLSKAQKDLKTANAEIRNLKKIREQLNDLTDELNEEKEELKGKNDKLTEENDKLKEENEELMRQNQIMKEKYENLESRMKETECTQEMKNLKDENEKLKIQIKQYFEEVQNKETEQPYKNGRKESKNLNDISDEGQPLNENHDRTDEQSKSFFSSFIPGCNVF